MNKEDIECLMAELTEEETAEFPYIWIAREIMEKHGCQCTCMKQERLVSYQEHPVHQKRLVLTYAVPTKEKDTLFSISQELEKLTKNFTKYSKKSKMAWYLTTDTQVDVEISEVLN